MKRILVVSAILLSSSALLTGCAGSPASSSNNSGEGAAAATPTPVDVYKGSDANDDPNYISHWVFKQQLSDGSVVECVAARIPSSATLGISCLPNTLQSPAPR